MAMNAYSNTFIFIEAKMKWNQFPFEGYSRLQTVLWIFCNIARIIEMIVPWKYLAYPMNKRVSGDPNRLKLELNSVVIYWWENRKITPCMLLHIKFSLFWAFKNKLIPIEMLEYAFLPWLVQISEAEQPFLQQRAGPWD